MDSFTILGRGKAGKALAAAWGGAVPLLPGRSAVEGYVLLAVPDAALPVLVQRFAGRCAHLCGSLDFEGVPCLHPLTSFDGAAADWSGAPLAVTGSPPEFLQAAFARLGFESFPLPPELKPLYHAAAVLSSGHAATLWLGAARLLAEAGVQLPGRGLEPLARATLRNLLAHGREGRTGPFARGDEATIARDAAALPEAWRELFLTLGRMDV
jgi:hypothetical protein